MRSPTLTVAVAAIAAMPAGSWWSALMDSVHRDLDAMRGMKGTASSSRGRRRR